MAFTGPQLPNLLLVNSLLDLTRFLEDDIQTIQTLTQLGLLRRVFCCNRACRLCVNRTRTDGVAWRCVRCRKFLSIRRSSFFEDSNLTIKDILVVIFCWSCKFQVQQTVDITGIPKLSILRWYKRIREECSRYLLNSPHLFRLGGPGCIVQIDESVVAKRKYNAGRLVPAQWVFGIYDTTTKTGKKNSYKALIGWNGSRLEYDVCSQFIFVLGYVTLVNTRDAATLIAQIEQYVLPGSHIWSDCWAAYNRLGNLGGVSPYQHFTVNHSRNFVDPATGTCTNAVEAYWSRLKRSTRYVGSRHILPDLLDEFMWRERFGQRGTPVFQGIILCLGQLYRHH